MKASPHRVPAAVTVAGYGHSMAIASPYTAPAASSRQEEPFMAFKSWHAIVLVIALLFAAAPAPVSAFGDTTKPWASKPHGQRWDGNSWSSTRPAGQRWDGVSWS